MKAILFVKKGKPTSERVIDYARKHFSNVIIYCGKPGDPFPAIDLKKPLDMLISYLSPWIIPEEVLRKTKLWNVNFHPGPPEYPGTGCFNFAVYNNERSYGVTAHLMEKKVDTGKIIGIKRFPLSKLDSVHDLTIKSYSHLIGLFFETMDFILKNNNLPGCSETWRRKPYTRRELERLCKIEPDMAEVEIRRRVKAATYPNMPGPYVELFGHKFEHSPDR